jgi:hypothetical protein
MKFSLMIKRNAKIASVDTAGNRLSVKNTTEQIYVHSDNIRNLSKCLCCTNTNIFFRDEAGNILVVEPHHVEIVATEVAAQQEFDAALRALEAGGGK